MTDALRFATLLPTLWAAHNVGDHLVQTDHQAMRKAQSWRAMVGHIIGYQAAQAVAVAAVLAATGLRCNLRALLVGMAFSGATHAFIDRRWPVRWLLRHTGSAGFAEMATPVNGPYQADQALHHGCLLIVALLMARKVGER
jgi:hypothetical protein